MITSISYRCAIHSQCYLLAKYFVNNLDLSNFLLESALPYFLFLSFCLLLVYFVSAAGCHCFDSKDSLYYTSIINPIITRMCT